MDWSRLACLLIQSEVCLEMVNECSTPPFQNEPVQGNQVSIISGANFSFLFPHLSFPSKPHCRVVSRGGLNKNSTLHVNKAFHPSIPQLFVNIIWLNIDYEHPFKAKKMGTMQVSDLPKGTH